MLAAANTNALPGYSSASRITVGNGATLALTAGSSGSSWTQTAIGSLIAANSPGFAAGSALGIDTSSGNFSLSNSVGGSMGLTKLGSNTLTLSYSNSYTGPTTISGGTLDIDYGGALQNSALVVPTAGGVVFDRNAGTTSFALAGICGSGNLVLQNTASAAVSITANVNTNMSYYGAMSGTGSLSKGGISTLILAGSNTYTGATSVLSGTLQFGDGTSGHDGSLAAAGGISNNSALVYDLFGPQNYAGNVSGNGSLTKLGNGTLTLTGSNNYGGSTTLNGGGLIIASTGSLTSTSGTLYVGKSSPASLTIQDSASVAVRELDVNYQYNGPNASTLMLTGGSLSVTGAAYIGRSRVSGPPTNTSAAFYQSGGMATCTGTVTVGYNGTATSILDIDGGTLSANNGLLVGGNPGNLNYGQGNGVVNLHGSGILNVGGNQGLLIGQDTQRATSGLVELSSGTLSVTGAGGITLGSGGGLATLSRSGGSMIVAGSLSIGGAATLLLDATTANVATSFGGTLVHSGTGTATGTLMLVPQTGHLSSTESVRFVSPPPTTNGIIGPWGIVETSGTNSAGDYLQTSGSALATFTGYYNGFSGAGSSSVVNIASPSSANNATVYALKVSNTATINSGQTLTVASGGILLNGGTISGGTLAFGATPLVFAGSSTASMIASTLSGTGAFVKFGPGTLALNADNSTTLSGSVAVTSGALDIERAGALGTGATTVAAGACLELVGSTAGLAVGNVPLTINGAGPGGNGALRNLSGNNSWNGPIVLGSGSQINTVGGILTLNGGLVSSSSLTKSGVGTLVLNCDDSNSMNGPVTVASGVLCVENGNAFGLGINLAGVTINSGATLQLQGGIAVPNVPLTLNGTGVMINGAAVGALDNSQGANSWAGPIALAADSQINVDSAAGPLTLSGNISGGFALVKGGSGTLQLAGSGSSFSGPLTILNGTLSVSALNATGSVGPLGQAASPVTLGGSGNTAMLEYMGAAAASSNRAFALAAGGTSGFLINQPGINLTLSGSISGNGNFEAAGKGIVTLSGSSSYTGTTTVAGGTLTVSGGGSLGKTSGIVVAPGASLQITAGTALVNQLPDSANVTLDGGTFSYVANSSVIGGETVGSLVLGVGPSTITTTCSGVTNPPAFLRFASAPTSHVPGATINFYSTNSQIQFQSNPPSLVGGILGGYAYWNNTDFATCSTTAPYVVCALSSSGYTTGNLYNISGSTANAKPSGSQSTIITAKEINSLNLTGGVNVSMSGNGSLTLDSGGLLVNTSGTISGGSVTGSNRGELDLNARANTLLSTMIIDHGGSTAFVVTGDATVTLGGPNTYTGGTIVTGGTLVLSNSNSLLTGTSLTVGDFQWPTASSAAIKAEPGATPVLPPDNSGSAAPVPEPGSFALLIAAVFSAAIYRRLRRRRGS
jgi:autotransporter-associated beta strand protein